MAVLACLMARSTEFLMPRPMTDRSPVSGAMTAILAILLPVVPVPASAREPQPVSARDATTTPETPAAMRR